MKLFEGLTERGANTALWNWLNDQGINMKRHGYGGFTDSLDMCRKIEKRLTDDQWRQYVAVLYERAGHHSTGFSVSEELILLDAPTRCRALIKVLGLGKESK